MESNKQNMDGKKNSFPQESSWIHGVLGNLIATTLGIVLTFGVASYVDRRKAEQQSREVMLNAIRSIEVDGEMLEKTDSVFNSHLAIVDKLINLYWENDKDLSRVPEDTLRAEMNKLGECRLFSKQGHSELYFFDAEIVHQFADVDAYQRFAMYLQFDKESFELINALYSQHRTILQEAKNKQIIDGKDLSTIVEELLTEHFLTDYVFKIQYAALSERKEKNDYFYEQMLKLAGVSEQEYKEYVGRVKG